MLDLKFIRENPELVKQGIKNKNEQASVDEILELDSKKRNTLNEVENLRAEHKKRSKEYADMIKSGLMSMDKQILDSKQTKDKINELEKKLKVLQSKNSSSQSNFPGPQSDNLNSNEKEERIRQVKNEIEQMRNKWSKP